MKAKSPADRRRKPLKRSIKISGHQTSVSLEDAFWDALNEIAATTGVPVSDIVSIINNERQYANLSSQIRLFVLGYYRG
jgi:predicted DNA-binding ribbon-helix-helix protein